FTWEAVEGSQNALERIVVEYSQMVEGDISPSDPHGDMDQFEQAITDDLNTPIAIAVLQKAMHRKIIDKMDEILGLNIKKLAEQITDIPSEIRDLQGERDKARKTEDWK